MKILVSPRAAEQVREVDLWWREHRADRAAFLDEFEHALELLHKIPELGALYSPKAAFSVRRLLLSRSQHYLYYECRREQRLLRVLAVWNCFRGRGPRLGRLERP